MKTDWIEQVKTEIAKKAGIEPSRYQKLEKLVDKSRIELRLPRLIRGESESMVAFTARAIKHFNLGREFDAKIPDSVCRSRARAKWDRYRLRQMGLK